MMNITSNAFCLLLILVSICASGCSSLSTQQAPPPPILGEGLSDEEIAIRILELTPIGTPMQAAMQSLRDAGLGCNVHTMSDSDEEYLLCSYADDRDFWVTMVWTICVQCENGQVSGATCQQAGIGM